jgi:hypothetical protein
MHTLNKVTIASAFAVAFIGLGCISVDYIVPDDQIEIPTVEKPSSAYMFQPLRSYARIESPVTVPKFVELNSKEVDKKIPNINGVLKFGSVKIPQMVVANVVSAAKKADMNPALLMAIADKESNFKLKVKAKTSSATGLFQFIDKTWMKAIKLFGNQYSQVPREKILSLRTDPYISALFAAKMLKKDGEELADKIGRELTAGETYLIHFLGPDDAEKFMKTAETTPNASAAALLPKPAQANKPIFYAKQGQPRTVAQVHDAFESMMGSRFKRYENVAVKLPKSVMSYTD